MRVVVLPLAAAAVTLSMFRLIAAPSPKDDLQSEQALTLSAKARGILLELKHTCDELHLRFVGSTDFRPEWIDAIPADTYDPLIIVGPTFYMGLERHAQAFKFRQNDGRLIEYENGLVGDLDVNMVPYDKPDQPKWSTAHAIEIGMAFKTIFDHSDDVLLGQPTAEYGHGIINGSKFYLGMWTISWPRVDSKGHPFYGDGVTIDIQEGFGPALANVYLTTPFAEEKGEPMTKSEAASIARQAAETKQIDRGFESYGDGDSLIGYKLQKAELLVVLPAKDPHVLGGPSTGVARLAWEVWLRPEHSKKPTGDLYDDSFAVWVDAYNRRILGSVGWM